MKRKLIFGSIILLSAIMIASVSNTLQLLFKEELSAIINTNIEALADDEHVAITQCFGKGSVDCPKSHRKVEYVFGGYSLEGLY